MIIAFAGCTKKEGAGNAKDAAEHDRIVYQPFVAPVGLVQPASEQAQMIARRIAETMEIKGVSPVGVADPRNCFLSIQVLYITNNCPGYVIQLFPGGGAIVATDDSQLLLASAAFMKLSKRENGQLNLPLPCVITSYPILRDKEVFDK